MLEKSQQKAIQILSGEQYEGFGSTLASEYLASQHKIEASRETVRKWMSKTRTTLRDRSGAVEGRPAQRGRGAYVTAAAEPVWRVGAIGTPANVTGWRN